MPLLLQDSVCGFAALRQYQGAGDLIGFGLRRRHLAHRKRLPLTAVFGRTFLPVLRMFFAITALACRYRNEKPNWRRNNPRQFNPTCLCLLRRQHSLPRDEAT